MPHTERSALSLFVSGAENPGSGCGKAASHAAHAPDNNAANSHCVVDVRNTSNPRIRWSSGLDVCRFTDSTKLCRFGAAFTPLTLTENYRLSPQHGPPVAPGDCDSH